MAAGSAKPIEPIFNHWATLNTGKWTELMIDFRRYCSEGHIVLNKQGQPVPFVLNEAQEFLASKLLPKLFAPVPSPQQVVIHKSRQMGVSVFFAILEKYVASRRRNLSLVHLLPTDKLATEFYEQKTYSLYAGSHPQLLPETRVTTKPHPYLKVRKFNGSILNSFIKIGGAGSRGAGRSGSNQVVVLDEYAFYTNVIELEKGLLATMPKVGLALTVYVSTADGINHFYDLVKEAKKAESPIDYIFLPWHMLKEYERDPEPGTRLDNLSHLTEYELKLLEIFEQADYPQESWVRKLAFYDYVLTAEAKNDEAFMRSEYPSCVVAGTRVGTKDGIIPIEEAYDGIEATRGIVSKTHIQKKSPVAKIITAQGFELIGTYDHPIKAGDKFIDLIKTKGSTVDLLPPTTASNPYTVRWNSFGVDRAITATEDLAEWIGYFLGNGSYSGHQLDIAFPIRDQDTISHIHNITKKLFGLDMNGRVSGSKKGGWNYRVQRKEFGTTLLHLGVIQPRNGDGHRRVLRVPEIIWRSPKNIQRAFLRGLFEADGFVSNNKRTRNNYIKLFAKSGDFIKDIQLLLLANGMVSKRRLAIRRMKSGGYDKEFPGTELHLNVIASTIFRDDVGFISKFKSDRIANNKPTHLSRPMLLQDEVISVEPMGDDYTYNLTVPGDSTFDANGIWTHNTPEESFESSGDPVLPVAVLMRWLQGAKDPQYIDQFITSQSGSLSDQIVWRNVEKSSVKQFKPPIPGRKYWLGIDPSAGEVDGDFTAGVVVDITEEKLEEVCTFKERIDQTEAAELFINLAKYYNNAIIIPERNMGSVLIQWMLMSGYHRIYIDAGNSTSNKTKYGIHTTRPVKNEAIQRMRFLMNNGLWVSYDQETIDEAMHFSWKKLPSGARQAVASGVDENNKPYHDDSVMAKLVLVAALDMRRYKAYGKLTKEE